MNWSIPTFQGGNFDKLSTALSDIMLLVSILRVKFLGMAIDS